MRNPCGIYGSIVTLRKSIKNFRREMGCTFMKERLIWSPSQAFSKRKCSRSKPPPEPRPACMLQSSIHCRIKV